ncbi:hypothetical protein U1Q18_007973, partial [Sarracenia purpurea var. burkii]
MEKEEALPTVQAKKEKAKEERAKAIEEAEKAYFDGMAEAQRELYWENPQAPRHC